MFLRLGLACAVTAATLIGDPTALAGNEEPHFDVVSVKPSGTMSFRIQANSAPVTLPILGFQYTPGRLTCSLPLKSLVEEAYSISGWQIGGPPWIGSDRYDVDATMPPDTSRQTARLMLRTMLAERFGLVVRQEQKESSVYGLVVGKTGFKLQPIPDAGPFSFRMGPGQFTTRAVPLTAFASWLTNLTDLPVIDMTQIAGAFKIEMQWTPDYQTEPRRWDAGVVSAVERLGLKLEPRKAMRNRVEIVHAERMPTPN